MRSLDVNDLVNYLQVELKKTYSDEEFLLEEFVGIIQGLINSVRWAALRASRNTDWGDVLKLKTEDHFCTEFLGREQIVNRIENTSGLEREMSGHALEIIEKRVDGEIRNDDDSAVEVEHIGIIEIEFPESPRYIIHLADELKVSPPTEDISEESATPFLER